MVNPLWNKTKTIFFDLDGCIYYGGEPAPGAHALLKLLRESGRSIGFISNNSRDSAAELSVRLRRMGIDAEAEEIVSAAEGVGQYLFERYGSLRLRVMGSESLRGMLTAAGHELVHEGEPGKVDCIVLGRDLAFTYDKLANAAALVATGTRVIACNPDLSHPGQEGLPVPETGALAAAIEAVIGRPIEYYGKPGAHLFQHAMRRAGAVPAESMMIGDTLDTDIVGGRAAGMRTVWLATLEQERKARAAGMHACADIRVQSLTDLYAYFERSSSSRASL